ncbi:MAG: hypothetical protein NBKEAIPA_02676 [Nitrospirae bacterium]|nr:MAG: hypothetical protein UZ03_NOB001000397 [Nitrospira sp. OLB3]MBV6470751.1 hypothetical protein [Nitrospirota bacterium]MCE7964834.1 hypothetical protein [Nitrospira sp. NTP2]MCK6492276.1 hypothetical protein [Nitrospira sp.]MEB2337999.1 hypothetical protein [Nitrospirales bacterium]
MTTRDQATVSGSSIRWGWSFFVLGCLFSLWSAPAPAADSESHSTREWNFDHIAPGSLPGSFVVGTLFDGRPAGEWKILITDRANSGSQVLAQLLPKGTDQAHKLLLIEGTNSADLDADVSYLAVSGKADLGGGLIWRAVDDRNYYLLRASIVEQKVRLYRVVKGVQQVVKQVDRPLATNGWHRLRIVQRGCEIKALYDETLLFRVCDNTFATGRIGLWTKADAVTYFDDLTLKRIE